MSSPHLYEKTYGDVTLVYDIAKLPDVQDLLDLFHAHFVTTAPLSGVYSANEWKSREGQTVLSNPFNWSVS